MCMTKRLQANTEQWSKNACEKAVAGAHMEFTEAAVWSVGKTLTC